MPKQGRSMSVLLKVGALKAVVQRGMKVSDDFCIVGFDDTPLATATIPEMTTVSEQSHELDRTAVQVLTKLLQKEKVNKLTCLNRN